MYDVFNEAILNEIKSEGILLFIFGKKRKLHKMLAISEKNQVSRAVSTSFAET